MGKGSTLLSFELWKSSIRFLICPLDLKMSPYGILSSLSPMMGLFLRTTSIQWFCLQMIRKVVAIKITIEPLNMGLVLQTLFLKFCWFIQNMNTYNLLIFYMFSLYSNVLRLLWYLLCVDLLFKEIRTIEPMDSFCGRKCCQWKGITDYFSL